MDESSFELIMQEVLLQKQRMDDLLAENRELDRQLADLREGRGIIVDIEGKQFALQVETSPHYSQLELDPTTQDTTIIVEQMPEPTFSAALVPMGTIPETPYPSSEEFTHIPQFSDEVENEAVPPTHMSSFLEDMLIDEFAAAATSPLAIWQAPDTKNQNVIDEEQKAALRKELMGSFLLE